ncbi:MAG TPA: nucleotidyltransferase [Thermoclostridium sp.]|nr:nucleotidyltransferase [Thermoclostridium sp.]HPU44883.1 nucleotidyltransferase [Thermoclostridium sp.]
MSVLGIVAEYNPLHSGHEWHIKKSLELTGADAAVCVLSSQFVQRGEPGIVNKQARARMALSSGIDLVLELPGAFSCASAEYFASAAIRILDSLGVVDYVSFGSETGSLDSIRKAADFLADENQAFREALKSNLDKGLSFPAARQAALRACLDDQTFEVVSSPNNILGIEYLKAIKRFNSGIRPVTIPRVGQGYNEKDLGTSYSSATAIRGYIRLWKSSAAGGYSSFSGTSDDVSPGAAPDTFSVSLPDLAGNLPESSLKILDAEFRTGRGPIFMQDFEDILVYRLRTASDQELMALPYMEEGLHNRLRQASLNCAGLDEILEYCTTSRYPRSRISRILCALLLGMTSSFLDELKDNGYARYIRVLGFNEKGRKLLASARKKAALPLITKPASYRKLKDPLARRLFEHEARITDVYALGYKRPELKLGGYELTAPPVMV